MVLILNELGNILLIARSCHYDTAFSFCVRYFSMIAAIPSLPVKDLMVSLQFYKEKLGFQLVKFEKTSASLRHGGVDLHLLEKSESTVMYCGFYVVNINTHLPNVLNVKQLGDIGKLRLNGQGELRFSMRDPDGNTIELIEQAIIGNENTLCT